jgi:2-methylisocitrate lyase-like PEP mutase family enzyme
MTGAATRIDRAAAFRALHVPREPIVLWNVWDAGSARAVARGGARALATGSWSVAAAHGHADGEALPLDLAMANLARITAATELPVSVDLESGYGEAAADVARTVARAIEAGAVGCNLEDSVPATGALRAIDQATGRVAAAREAAERAGVALFLNARTDVFFQAPPDRHDRSMVDDAIERGAAYARAGADGLFVPGLVDPVLIAQVVDRSPLPVNVMIAAGSPTLARLAELGVARISHGPGPYLAAMKLLEDMAAGRDLAR